MLSSRRTSLSRRRFLRAAGAAACCAPSIMRASEGEILGHGEHRYRVVERWGVLDEKTPVKNCHGIVCTKDNHIVLLTDHTANNFLIYDTRGRLVEKRGTAWPGAHGLSLVEREGKELLYFTDLQRHRVFLATLGGELLGEWAWPGDTGKYPKEDDYRPSWTLHAADGSFFVLDGYGRDYITRYDKDGRFAGIFGGAEGGIVHWGPHGGMLEATAAGGESLLIAMSDQQYLMRLDTAGKKLAQYDLPGGNPRQIRRAGKYYYVAHLGDNWPRDQNCRGFVSILDENFKVVSNPGGTAPFYDDGGKLQPMKHAQEVFRHPHDLCVDREGSIYVAQFASGNTYPIKLERV